HQVASLATEPHQQTREKFLAAFLSAAALVQPWPQIETLIDLAISISKENEGWSKAWLRALKTQLKAPPSEDSVVRYLAENFLLIHSPQLGWYRYLDAGLWKSQSDGKAKQLISNKLGRHRTGNRTKSISLLAESEFDYSKDLNPRRDLINCPNGMLDLSTMSLLPHNPAYYSSIQLGYPYNPSAQCPGWLRFVNEVFNDATDQTLLLQEVFGYCLLPDTRFQQAFCLLGQGANGKSAVLHVLSRLVGEANVSHLEISELRDGFSIIDLHGSLVNLATETRGTIRGAETIFKKVVAGDVIRGCHKYKEPISFAPFCTLVFAANDFAEAHDTSHGFLRRWVFLLFPVEFCDNPSEPNQKQRTPSVETHLFEELPGILNWSCQGLSRLLANNAFTQTTANKDLRQEFTNITSTVHAWLEDEGCILADWRTRRAIYTNYHTWCERFAELPLTAQRFVSQLRRAVPLQNRRLGGGREIRQQPTNDPI
ncbi:hypothetical protein LCGC14_1686160, partial [marine sediment metagenome]